MPRIIRTIRFLCAINHVKFILTPDWLRESFKAKRLLGKKSNGEIFGFNIVSTK